MTSSIHVDIKKNDILILGEDPTPGFFAEKKCSINFTVTGRKFYLSLHYNGELVSYFLMIQKLLNSKQMILKLQEHHYVYYIANKDVLKESAKNQYRNLSEEKRR